MRTSGPIRVSFRACMMALLVLTIATVAAAAPSITSLSPTSGAVGASVTITGSGFGSTQGSSTVKFNTTTVTSITSWSATSIVAIVPTGATSGNVTVTVSGTASNGKSFSVVSAPSTTSVSPTSGGIGASVTIAGSNFGSTRGTSTVKFNGTAVVTYTSWSASSIVVVVPSGATTGNVVVHAAGVDSNGQAFTVVPTPAIANLSPTSGNIGDSVTITGTNFGATQGSSTVKFNGTTATPTSWSDTSIVTTVPTGATTGNVVVTTGGGASAGVSFTVIATPSITSLSPTSGAVGAAVTITGTNFQPTQGSSTVTFNGTPVTTITSWSATQIKTVVPAGATTGNVVVTAFGLASSGRSFTVKPTPVITSASPTVGAIGMTVMITGANFGSTQGSSTVKFNGTTATPTSWTASQIVVPVPTGATTGPLVVHTSGVDTNSVTFTVSTLTSIEITPSGISIPINSLQRLTAIGHYSNGSTQSLGSNATWTSDASSASIDSTGLATVLEEGDTTFHAAFGSQTASATLLVTPSRFIKVGKTHWERETATVLADGRVLLLGGETTNPTAELYDPATGNFTYTGNPHVARVNYTATRLPNGKVLVAGGYTGPGVSVIHTFATAELYDPTTGTFDFTGSMSGGHYNHAATLLANGTVLNTGGYTYEYNGTTVVSQGYPAGGEIYDPATGTFTTTGSLVFPRLMHSATLLNDGTVLVVGGTDADNQYISTAELYDPSTGSFAATGTAPTYTGGPALLTSGAVLFAGGRDPALPAQFYDPASHAFTPGARFNVDRYINTVTRLNDGTVLIVGGLTSTNNNAVSAELYDPSTQTFIAAGSTSFPRVQGTATLLNDGTVLFTGGSSSTAELYVPTSSTAPAPSSLRVTPSNITLAVGESAQFRAVDNHGYPRIDATWTVSDATLATITDEGLPTLTAVAAGTVTLTATIQGVSADAHITISSSATPHAIGTAYWSIPMPSGATVQQVVQAGGPGGPALFAIGTLGTQSVVQGLTYDGQQIWESWMPLLNGSAIPDRNGGLIVFYNPCNGVNHPSINRLDGMTGDFTWGVGSVSTCLATLPQIAIRPDGVLVIAAPGNTSGFPELMLLDGATGQTLGTPPIPQSSFDDAFGHTAVGYSRIGPPVVDSNGVAYVEYEVRHVGYPPHVITTTLWIRRMASDGGWTDAQLTTTTTDTNLFPGRIIPDGHGGVLATWTFSPSNPPADANPLRAAHVDASGTVTEFNLPTQPAQVLVGSDSLPVNPTLLLGENDKVFASYGSDLQSFNVLTGVANWSYSSAPNTIGIVATDDDEGAVAKVTDSSGTDTVLTFSASGTATTTALTGSKLDHAAGNDWVGFSLAQDAVGIFVGPWVELSTGRFGTLIDVAMSAAVGRLVLDPSTSTNDPDPKNPGQTLSTDAIHDTLVQLQAKLQADPTGSCATWLTDPTDTNPPTHQASWPDYLGILLAPNMSTANQHSYGRGVFNTVANNFQLVLDEKDIAAVGPAFPDGWLLGVNDIAGFYKRYAMNGYEFHSLVSNYLGATPRIRAESLLHELGHLIVPETKLKVNPGLNLADLMVNDGMVNNQSPENKNQKLVDKKCGALVRTFPK